MNNNDPGLFDNPAPRKPARSNESAWFFASNHVNLLTMLSAGLLMSPGGFGDTYYADPLKAFPGYLPFFNATVPKKVLGDCVSEENFLIPCLAGVTLASLRGEVVALYGDGTSRAAAFPEGLDGTELAILVPAPLPASWIERIVFRSKEDKGKCEALAKSSANVPLDRLRREVDPGAFQKPSVLFWPPQLSLEDRDVRPDLPLALGGMLAMLYQIANRGDAAVAACRLAFEGGRVATGDTGADPFEQALGAWLQQAGEPGTGDIALSLFWKIVDRVIAFRSESGAGRSALDIVLSLLERETASLEKNMQDHLVKLTGDLRSLAGFSESSVGELFKRHTKYFSRALLLFFLRETCAELLELRLPDLKESDCLAAALLFSAREGWIDLPLELRGYPELEPAVAHRMAAAAHRLAGSGLDLGPAPPRAVPYREFLAPGARGWSAGQREVALRLARECGWDCISTRIDLGKGDYRLVVDGSGAHLLLPGEVKAVTAEVAMDTFLAKLAETRLSRDLDSRVRLSAPKGLLR